VERNGGGIINYKEQAFTLCETRTANKSDYRLSQPAPTGLPIFRLFSQSSWPK